MDKKLFLISYGNVRVITWAYDRENAKRNAHRWIGGRSDAYIVEPLSDFGNRVHLDITLQV